MGAITKLEAVNHILLMAGESLVNDLDGNSGLDTDIALLVLDRFIQDFQLRGMANNSYVREYDLSADGNIELQTNTLSAELISYHVNTDGDTIFATAKPTGGKILLYNNTDQNGDWDANKKYRVEIVFSITWEDMDTPIQRAVMAAAARQYQIVMQGDADVDSYLSSLETMYLIKAKGSDVDDKRYSIWRSVTGRALNNLNRTGYGTNDPSKFRFWRHT